MARFRLGFVIVFAMMWPLSVLAQTPQSASDASPIASPVASPSALPWLATANFVAGDAQKVIPQGKMRILDVVRSGLVTKYGTTSLAIVVRNNTAGPLYHVIVNATSSSSHGQLFAVATQSPLHPNVLNPGDIAFGTIDFGSATITPDLKFEITATGDPNGRSAYDQQPDVSIESIQHIENRIVGVLKNTTGTPMKYITPQAICFTGDTIESLSSDQLRKDKLNPGEELPFQLELVGKCDQFLITVQGFQY